MKNAIAIIAFAIRHFLAVIISMALGCIAWSLFYLFLLLYALCFGGSLGSPIAYPLGLLLICSACAWIGWGIFAPAAGIGRIFCWFTAWPQMTAIPIVFASAFALLYLVYLLSPALLLEAPVPSPWVVLKNFTLFLSVPLAIYWWLTEGFGALTDAIMRWLADRSEKTQQQPTDITLQ